MADTFTPNLNLTLVEVGGSVNTWGAKVNDNMTALDTAVAARIPIAGGLFTGPVGIDGGSESAPGFYFDTSTGSGFFSDTDDELAITIAETEIGRFSSTGLLMSKLAFDDELNGYVSTVNHFRLEAFETDANNGGLVGYTRTGGSITEKFRFDENGRLGLGQSSPAALLDRNGTECWNVVDMAAGTAINLALGNHFYKTISATTTFTITNTPGSRGTGFILELTDGGSETINWPASVKWPNGVAPVLTASGVDVLFFVTRDGGTTWRGALSQQASA